MFQLCDQHSTYAQPTYPSTYQIKSFKYLLGFLSDNSSLPSDELDQLAMVLVQRSQESCLKWNSCNPEKLGIDLKI